MTDPSGQPPQRSTIPGSSAVGSSAVGSDADASGPGAASPALASTNGAPASSGSSQESNSKSASSRHTRTSTVGSRTSHPGGGSHAASGSGASSSGTPARDALVPFGLEFIDSLTGGLIRDKLYLLSGAHSALKTSMALTFLYEALKNDQRTLYITSQDPEGLLVQADRLGLNLRPYLRDDRLTLLTYLPRLSQQVALLTDYRRVIAEVKRLTAEQPIDRVVIDPVEALVALDNKSNVLPSTRLLIDALKSMGSTLLCLVDEVDDAQLQVLLKEFIFLSFGAFQIESGSDGTFQLKFQKIIWNPREYPRLPVALRNQQGVLVIEVQEPTPSQTPQKNAVAANISRNEQQEDPLSSGRLLQLLLIDNDEIYHEMLQDFLKSRYQVDLVRDSVEAIARLSGQKYDVIMVNMNMPRVDGREVCLRIRQHQGPVPLVAFSNQLKRGSDIAGVLRIGADSFITRPLAFNQVKATLDSVMRRPASVQNYERAKELIQEIEAEKVALQYLVSKDPSTGLTPPEYFERKLKREVEKARVGDYSFAVVGYSIQHKNPAVDIDPKLMTLWRPLARAEDMILRYAPGFYLVYLEECLPPGVKRFNERLRKAIAKAIENVEFNLHYEIAMFPSDGTSYESLLELALKPLRETRSHR